MAVVIILMIHIQNCVPYVVIDINVKVLNLMSRTNEIKDIKWQETCKYTCWLDAIVFNNKQSWNNDKCRCESEKFIDKRICDKILVIANLGVRNHVM